MPRLEPEEGARQLMSLVFWWPTFPTYYACCCLTNNATITEKKLRFLYENDAQERETDGEGGFEGRQTAIHNASKQSRPCKTKVPKSDAVTWSQRHTASFVNR